MPPSFQDLQNGLYNFIQDMLGLTNANNLQLIQPGVSLPSGTTNATVWSFMNEIPLLSSSESGFDGDQFFSDYEALMSALQPSVNINLESDIGSAAYNAWQSYLGNLSTAPNPTQQPSMFFNWAFNHGFYSVAAKGSSDLSAMLLEPIYRAQLALQPYVAIQGVSPGKPPDWSLGYTDLVSQLAGGESKTGSISNLQSNSNISGSWAAGGSSGGFLLWGGGSSSSNSSISANFASQAINFSGSIAHTLTFVPVPGVWYDSAALGLAYATQNGSPWNPTDSEVTWAKMFGPSGDMQRFASGLIVVSGMNFQATSTYEFSATEQTTINQNSNLGLWPFYSSSSSSSITTTHSFNNSGQLTVTAGSPPNVPIVIGRTILPVSEYVGSEAQGKQLFLQLSSATLERLIA